MIKIYILSVVLNLNAIHHMPGRSESSVFVFILTRVFVYSFWKGGVFFQHFWRETALSCSTLPHNWFLNARRYKFSRGLSWFYTYIDMWQACKSTSWFLAFWLLSHYGRWEFNSFKRSFFFFFYILYIYLFRLHWVAFWNLSSLTRIQPQAPEVKVPES